ncbi:DNA primase [Mesorhizobium xinjiangense]|uniref:DNA primase n=1 Tax=Mesorhizobium xinjiangense TaxID=2678685 RepID=UPI0012ED42CF|nr:DNA primase [Mesorhizobium xinjiangense]
MRFPPAFLDEIRDRVPISSVIGGRVSWDKRKTNASRGDYWACCPFHGEKSPSFHCEDRKGRYHCFGCGVSGDHFRFLTELDGLSFPEAVERIADMAGVAMPARDPEAERRESARASLHDVMELATKFFQEQLQSSVGAKARAYLRDRALTPATQQAFRLGYAPDGRNVLKNFLAGKGVGQREIEACGLVVSGEDIAVSYDRFRDRIMFPIEDARGRVIAFGGRALSPDVPAKYLNSPETDLFHKGNVLYNLARARKGLGREGKVIAVEGYMDVIALAQAGIANAVAPLGTALTESQLELLWRMSGEPVLCFDGDQAGLKAAYRVAELALPVIAAGRSVRFAMMPQGQDPDDLVKAGGPEAFEALVAEARPLAEMLWQRETAGGVFDTPERRADLERKLRELTGRIRDENVRRHYSQDMRERAQAFFGSARPARRDGWGSGAGKGGRPGQAAGRLAVSQSLARSALVRSTAGTMPMREAVILTALINHPQLIDEAYDTVERLDFDHGDLKRLHAGLLDAIAHDEAADRDGIVAALGRRGLGQVWETAQALVRRARQWPALPDAALDDAREALGQALHLHHSAGALHKELKAAEAALASEPTEEHYRQLLEIQTQFRDVQAIEALIEGFGVLSGRTGRNQ